ncbi:MAG: PAS domain-containing protein [Bacteriovoracia bacterium]
MNELLLNQYDSYISAINAHAIVAVTDEKGVITFVNDMFCKISKYSREELIGKTHKIINSGFHSKEFFKGLWETISSGNTWKGEIRNKARDGSFYWMATTIVPFKDSQGKVCQYVSLRTDITHLKNLEQQLELDKSLLEIRVAEKTFELIETNRKLVRENFENGILAREINQQKEEYAYLFNHASDAIVILSFETGVV